MTINKNEIRVFVGSPTDVSEERKAAVEVVDALAEDELMPSGYSIKAYGWDITTYPRLASNSPQANIDGELDVRLYDIAIFILWSRIGTQLDSSYPALPCGKQPTGTEHEFYRATQLEAGEQGSLPDVELFRKTAPVFDPTANNDDMQAFMAQARATNDFVESVTKKEAAWVGEVVLFADTEEFKTHLSKQLKKLVQRIEKGADANQSSTSRSPTETPPLRNLDLVPSSYLGWLKSSLPEISFLGLDTCEVPAVRLPQIYVPAMVPDWQRRDEQDNDADTPRGMGSGEDRQQLLLSMLNQQSVFIHGKAGAGKSTFCTWLCWVISNGGLPGIYSDIDKNYQESVPGDLLGRLPILCRLREFAGYIDCKKDAGNWTAAQLTGALCDWLVKKCPLELPSDQFIHHLNTGNCLMIFDGLDEVPEYKLAADSKTATYPRAALLSGLKQALPGWEKAGNRVLLTSRPHGLSAANRAMLELETVELLELDQYLQACFAQRWFTAVNPGKSAGQATKFNKEMADRPDLRPFRRNPLLLTALCVKYSEGKRLPKDIYDLYRSVVDRVLHNRYITHTHEVEPIRNRLSAVAWYMQGLERELTQPDDLITVQDIDSVLIDYASNNPYDEGSNEGQEQDAASKRKEILSNSGLLLEVAEQRAEFYHAGFRDFLFAERFIQRSRLHKIDTPYVLAHYAAEPQWQPALVFLFAGWISHSSSLGQALEEFTCLLDQLSEENLKANPQPAIVLGECLQIAAMHGVLVDWAEHFQQACLSALVAVADARQRETLFISLDRLGLDTRPGVGLTANGLPDIDWLPVEESGKPEFYIARYPVTQQQFQAFIDAEAGYANPDWWQGFESMQRQPGLPRWREGNHPRINVDWYEAIAFSRWFSAAGKSAQKGWKTSLPTGHQWQIACVGRSEMDYPWGKRYENGRANVSEDLRNGGINLGRTSAVGLYPTGRALCGAEDMNGNVWEWCLDLFDQPENSEIDDKDGVRVVRGGSWSLNPDLARAALRDRLGPDFRDSDLGFRVVCVPH